MPLPALLSALLLAAPLVPAQQPQAAPAPADAPTPGTLNVFKGKNTVHRVTPVKGDRARIIAVLTYYERPGVRFTEEEQMGFYGRAA